MIIYPTDVERLSVLMSATIQLYTTSTTVLLYPTPVDNGKRMTSNVHMRATVIIVTYYIISCIVYLKMQVLLHSYQLYSSLV